MKSLANFLGLASLLGLLGEEDSLDVGEDTTLGNSDSGVKLVQFLVIADGELQVTGDDTGLLVVTGGITGQLKDLSGQVFHNSGQVHGGTGTNTLGVVTLAEQAVDTTDRELESSTAGSGLCLSLNFASFTTSRHDECYQLILESKMMSLELKRALFVPSNGFERTPHSQHRGPKRILFAVDLAVVPNGIRSSRWSGDGTL